MESGIVDVEISGPDADRLLALGERVRSLFQAAPDIRDNDDDWGNKIVKVVVEIDQDRARQLGVTSEEVARLLNTYFSGTAVSIYREGDNAIPIVLRAGAYTSQSLEGLTSATFAKNGGLISLAQVARLKPGFDLARIRRKNQERTITVTARSTSLTAGQLLESIQPGLQALDLAGTYHVAIGGEIQKSAETNQKLAAGFPIALAVMVLAIILQFNSFRRTLLTFMSIPLILIGIPFGLLGRGTTALVLRHARHHQPFRHHHQQCHRADRSDRYRAGEAAAARCDRGRVGKALASDPADLGNDSAWTGADGDRRRRIVAADGGA